MHFSAHLIVGGEFDRLPGCICQACRYLSHLGMFVNSSHREACGEKKQPTNAFLESRV
jgi:hypothetical protein